MVVLVIVIALFIVIFVDADVLARDPVTAMRSLAVVETGIAIVIIIVITSFTRIDHAVTA